jgi:hypothetical protein
MRSLSSQGILLFVIMIPTILSSLASTASAATPCVFRQVDKSVVRTAFGYVLEVDLLADYKDAQSFCGHMEARSSISTPPHQAVGGTLYTGITKCQAAIAQESQSLSVGNRPGESSTSQTSAIATPCGWADATFISSSAYQNHGRLALYGLTDLVYGHYLPSRTNAR